ncbi:hypothetical protein Hdeb2414_s0008g00280171 [Helianthus debilis subsp. tardiflorus]
MLLKIILINNLLDCCLLGCMLVVDFCDSIAYCFNLKAAAAAAGGLLGFMTAGLIHVFSQAGTS